jgi:hypothetical protein
LRIASTNRNTIRPGSNHAAQPAAPEVQMAKKTVSHRLDEALIARADAYAEGRGSTRSVLIEEGLTLLLDMAERGVPDLPVGQDIAEDVEAMRVGSPKPRAISGVVRASSLVPSSPLAMERQRKLNEAAARARAGAPKGRARP